MKNKRKTKILSLSFLAMILVASSCNKKEDPLPMQTGIQRSSLSFTEVVGEPHGDHFHGLGELTGSKTHTLSFDSEGKVQSGGHFHLKANGIYRLELKAWDHTGREVQTDFIANKDSAANYKAFLTGGGFILNTDSEEGKGAIFQTRETKYADGSDVGGAIETTGVISYFRIGEANVKSDIGLSFVLRRLDSGEKEKISRSDWQDETKFRGRNLLRLDFEPHVDGAHDH